MNHSLTPDKVLALSIVKIRNLNTKAEMTFTLVAETEADIKLVKYLLIRLSVLVYSVRKLVKLLRYKFLQALLNLKYYIFLGNSSIFSKIVR
ncbi:MAG: hypothetical protein CM15mP23_04240 [Cryomorphaceae bacterium]|nr:MAG: hypothetical protein CM15mP23_04240 [Cryomorphaceae bacterium]